MQALITISEAEKIISAHAPVLGKEVVSIQAAHGRLLRQAVAADRPTPPFDRAMMDGIALHSSALLEGHRELPIAGIQAAGEAQKSLTNPHHCLEVMTGAVLPSGADCIIKIEDIDIAENTAHLHADATASAGQFVHPAGSDCKAGDILLDSGALLGPAELAIAASCGATELSVSRIPRILLITTGDEVIDPAETPLPHQIRRSHPSAIISAIESRQLGNLCHLHLPDRPEELETAIEKSSGHYDLTLLTGGISMGKFDYVAPVLEKLIGTAAFHGIQQRPGKPFAYWPTSNLTKTPAESDGRAVFCLPGNPVSVIACLARYVIPTLRKMRGEQWQPSMINLTESFDWKTSFAGLIAGQVINNQLHPRPPKNSGDYAALAGCTGVCQVEQGTTHTAPFYPW